MTGLTSGVNARVDRAISYVRQRQLDQNVAAMTRADPVCVRPLIDAEQAARSLGDFDLVALPVVDVQRRLPGVLNADGAADILEAEATRCAERQVVRKPLEVPYLRASPFGLWRKRLPGFSYCSCPRLTPERCCGRSTTSWKPLSHWHSSSRC